MDTGLTALGKCSAATGLVLGTFLITRSAPSSFAADKPLHSAIAIYASWGAGAVVFSRFLHRKGREHEHDASEAVPLREASDWDVRDAHGGEHRTRRADHLARISARRQLGSFSLGLVLLLCIRAEVVRQVLRNVQCSTRSGTPWVPLALAVWEWLQRRRDAYRTRDSPAGEVTRDNNQDPRTWASAVARTVNLTVAGVAMVSIGSIVVLEATAPPRSTVVCVPSFPLQTRHWQSLEVFLDVVIVWLIGHLLNLQPHPVQTTLAAVGSALLTASAILLLVGTGWYFHEPADREWIRDMPPRYLGNLLTLGVYSTATLLCAVSLVLHVGVVTTSLLATFISVLTVTTVTAYSNAAAFPPSHLGLALLGISLSLLGIVAYVHRESTDFSYRSPLFSRRTLAFFHLTLFVIFLVWTGLGLTTPTSVKSHPIDLLLDQGRDRHVAFVERAMAGSTLDRAAKNYRDRYQRYPPPGFDHWREFAVTKKSVIIDDFDGIDADLAPFWALEPRAIRERTLELISNPWNDVAGISIRGGKAAAMESGIAPTHAWMVGGTVEMIGNFAQHLPDMDIAINLNDEPRVAVPFERLERMKQAVRDGPSPEHAKKPPTQRTFSHNRGEGWPSLPETLNTQTPLEEHSWQRIFHSYGAPTCPPSSPARTTRTWDTSTLCTSCMAPHSYGAFLADWTLAGDICHQPDLADLHGFFLSPAAFKGSKELYPIFSQSKVGGFNDILYPSAWNYIGKVSYDPNEEFPDRGFAAKRDVLFWRGSTTEGVSQGWGQWKGMVRQRFVSLLSTRISSRLRLLPYEEHKPHHHPRHHGLPIPPKLAYTSRPAASPPGDDKTDVALTEILRCANRDCSVQNATFPLAPGQDFQAHWSYRYLLDLDGAGFSGRFLPFLHSRSLPVKAGIFRGWWDGRIEAWKHFVPVDVRGSDVAMTMDYLRSGQGMAHGEKIAKDGREWAGKVLRKEDMEIYMFRLLLEWGRITDDARDSLGFLLEK